MLIIRPKIMVLICVWSAPVVSMCCVVCVLSSHLFWTSDLWTHQPGSHRKKVTRISPLSFCGDVCMYSLYYSTLFFTTQY